METQSMNKQVGAFLTRFENDDIEGSFSEWLVAILTKWKCGEGVVPRVCSSDFSGPWWDFFDSPRVSQSQVRSSIYALGPVRSIQAVSGKRNSALLRKWLSGLERYLILQPVVAPFIFIGPLLYLVYKKKL
jgi:hypothetical protein